jgi:hypothetical protein
MGMVKIKTGVKPKSLVILAAVANVAQVLPFDVIITSGNDSKHMKTSKHYSDEALDVRSKNFPNTESKKLFLEAVLKRLGQDYQGILEDLGGANEHIHIEYDPA